MSNELMSMLAALQGNNSAEGQGDNAGANADGGFDLSDMFQKYFPLIQQFLGSEDVSRLQATVSEKGFSAAAPEIMAMLQKSGVDVNGLVSQFAGNLGVSPDLVNKAASFLGDFMDPSEEPKA